MTPDYDEPVDKLEEGIRCVCYSGSGADMKYHVSFYLERADFEALKQWVKERAERKKEQA